MSQKTIKIFDTTLRDGEQAPGNSMNLNEKVRIAKQLERLGVDTIEAGFPIASPDDFRAVQAISKICQKSEICALARATEKDIKCAAEATQEAIKPRIHTFIATSEIHMKHKLNKTPQEILQIAIKSVKLAKSLCQRVDFSPEDAVRSNPEFLYKIIEAVINEGADTINIPDTVGYSTPEEFGTLISGIKNNVPNINQAIIATHCHNDLGMATANSLAGIKAGANQIECTINGIGERAGNAALEEIVMALQTRKDFFLFNTNIKTKQIYPTSRLLSSITGVPVQPNKAIVGANAFAHESGIHQDGILKERQTYEIMKAQDIGIKSNKLILGKHSGRHALKNHLESLGYNIKETELNQIFQKFKELADKKKEVFDEDLILLINEKEKRESIYTFKNIIVTSGTINIPNAEITLSKKGQGEIKAKSIGDGPIDAAYGAINHIINLPNTLLEYSVNAVTEGIDAQATVAVQIKVAKKVYSGSASDTDIIIASVKAYLEALNKALTI